MESVSIREIRVPLAMAAMTPANSASSAVQSRSAFNDSICADLRYLQFLRLRWRNGEEIYLVREFEHEVLRFHVLPRVKDLNT